jgi:Family of unknown function (DUF6804)/Protein of unknown function (DUF3592)
MKRSAGLYIAWLVAAGLLVSAAAQRHPYSFYTLLRWICCPVFAYSTFAAHGKKHVPWVWVFGVLAALYNTIFHVALDRSTWIIVNWLTVGAILIAIGFFWASETRIIKQAAPKDGEALRDGLTQAEQAELKQLGGMRYDQWTEAQGRRWDVLDAKREQAKDKASERKWVIGILIAALVCFYFAIDTWMRDDKRFNKATELAQGKVVELGVEDDERDSVTIADYKFKVNGVDYEGWTADDSLSKGDPVQVYYNPSDPEFNHAKGDGSERFFNHWAFFGIICLIMLIGTVYEQRKKSGVAAYDEQAAQAAYDRYRRSMERQGRIKPQN